MQVPRPVDHPSPGTGRPPFASAVLLSATGSPVPPNAGALPHCRGPSPTAKGLGAHGTCEPGSESLRPCVVFSFFCFNKTQIFCCTEGLSALSLRRTRGGTGGALGPPQRGLPGGPPPQLLTTLVVSGSLCFTVTFNVAQGSAGQALHVRWPAWQGGSLRAAGRRVAQGGRAGCGGPGRWGHRAERHNPCPAPPPGSSIRSHLPTPGRPRLPSA